MTIQEVATGMGDAYWFAAMFMLFLLAAISFSAIGIWWLGPEEDL
ncbi:hypothetical protein [Mesorhizobium sp. ESP-6-4]|nr:hypothetical protein [Mesorhizobium sp. ESP-6-4]